MLNRDFTKPKRDYILKNKLYLIVALVALIVGAVVIGVFGLNKSVDYTGCYKVIINVGQTINDKTFDKYEDKLNNILNSSDMELYSVQLKGEGMNTSLEVKYIGKISDKKIEKINAGIVTEINVNSTDISEHEFLKKTIHSTDIIFAVVGLLLITVIAVIFAMFRYNIAYAMSMLVASIFSIVGLVICSAVLRLSIEASYLAVIVLTLVYTLFETISLFENMREVSLNADDKKDYAKHIVKGMKKVHSRMQFSAVAIFVVGLALVFFGTNSTRSTAINLMFGVVMALVAVCFVVPFVYNLTIDKLKYNRLERKETSKDTTKKVKQAELVETKTNTITSVENEDVKTETETKVSNENEVVDVEESKVEVVENNTNNIKVVENEVVETNSNDESKN